MGDKQEMSVHRRRGDIYEWKLRNPTKSGITCVFFKITKVSKSKNGKDRSYVIKIIYPKGMTTLRITERFFKLNKIKRLPKKYVAVIRMLYG